MIAQLITALERRGWDDRIAEQLMAEYIRVNRRHVACLIDQGVTLPEIRQEVRLAIWRASQAACVRRKGYYSVAVRNALIGLLRTELRRHAHERDLVDIANRNRRSLERDELQ